MTMTARHNGRGGGRVRKKGWWNPIPTCVKKQKNKKRTQCQKHTCSEKQKLSFWLIKSIRACLRYCVCIHWRAPIDRRVYGEINGVAISI